VPTEKRERLLNHSAAGKRGGKGENFFGAAVTGGKGGKREGPVAATLYLWGEKKKKRGGGRGSTRRSFTNVKRKAGKRPSGRRKYTPS